MAAEMIESKPDQGDSLKKSGKSVEMSRLAVLHFSHVLGDKSKLHKKCIPKSMPKLVLSRVEEMPTLTDRHFCLGISSTPHKMAWNRL